jgi:hypothetical protein
VMGLDGGGPPGGAFGAPVRFAHPVTAAANKMSWKDNRKRLIQPGFDPGASRGEGQESLRLSAQG